MTITYFDKGEFVYKDGQISDSVYFVNRGTVKLYGEFGFSFAQFKNGATFGDNDVFTQTHRNGSANAYETSSVYKIYKD